MAAFCRHHKRGDAAFGRATSFVVSFVLALNSVNIVAITTILVLHVGDDPKMNFQGQETTRLGNGVIVIPKRRSARFSCIAVIAKTINMTAPAQFEGAEPMRNDAAGGYRIEGKGRRSKGFRFASVKVASS